ncbi:MAG TPA: HAMP domain-containing sensor histidine kinase [Gaiellaceae bacterium]|nr:HAMP domain-containing sensor histidine kinase [Gaiellaceae bacterium]
MTNAESLAFEGITETLHLRRLTELGRALTYATSLDQVARVTVQQGAALLEAPAAVLMLADRGGEMQVRASHGITAERASRFSAPLTEEVFGRLQGLFEVPDDRLLAVPLVVGGAVTGLLAVALPQRATDADEWLLSALADQAAVALEGARLGGEVRLEMEGRLSASEGATNAKDRALATLAHDIRSPLGAIDSYCSNLEDGIYGSVTDRQRHALGRVRMSGQHLLSLLDSVMDMARLTAGVMPVPLEPMHSMLVAREAVDILAPAALAKRQTLQLDAGADLVVVGNHARVRQVLVNLVGNAVKFTPEDGTITVATRLCTVEGASWGEIVVTDTGPGIAAAERAAIFEPYYRSAGTASLPGVGLGLAISHALVAQMGGVLDLESEVGVGSSFAIRLPLRASGE